MANNPAYSFNLEPGAFTEGSFGTTPSSTRIPLNEAIDSIGMPEEIEQALEISSSMMSGELPDEVLDQIESSAARRGFQRGIGGQAGRNLTMRDLGINAFQAMQQGIQNTLAVGAIKKEFDTLVLEQRQHEDEAMLRFMEADRETEKQKLGAVELIISNQEHTQDLINALIIENSRQAIGDTQQMNEMIGRINDYFIASQEALLSVANIEDYLDTDDLAPDVFDY